MRLIVLDEDFNTLGAIPLFRTLIWTRRYEKLGCYELYTTKDYFSLLNSGKYLYRNDADELGLITEVNYSQDENGKREVYAKGNFAEALLYDRVINNTVTLSGTLETVMRSLVTKYAIEPSDSDRVIANLQLGGESGLTATIDSQVTGENLSEELYALGNVEGYSHRIRYDYLMNALYFEVWQGKDRRDSQTDNSWAIFSNSFYNIRTAVYNRDESEYKNYAYVAGEEDDEGNRTVIEVDVRTSEDEPRKELYVDARDLQSEDEDGNTLSSSEYEALLTSRGLTKLETYKKSESVTSEIDSAANLVYKEDFDLGDTCTYINTEIGIETDQIITEIMETYEGGSKELTVTFDDSGLSTVQQLVRREVT